MVELQWGALGALVICISLETEKVITALLQALPDFMSSLVPQVRDQEQGWTPQALPETPPTFLRSFLNAGMRTSDQ